MSRPRRVTVLGSTGSIGRSTLDILAHADEPIEVQALTAGGNVDLAVEQARRWRPALLVMAEDQAAEQARAALADQPETTVLAGEDAIVEAASRPADWIMAAIVGVAGLRPTWAAAGTGATLALANKESLVCCGPALTRRVDEAGGVLIPVDSEHSAIFQVLEPANRDRVERLVLTASGGPFRQRALATLAGVTPEEAVAHPNWSMGAKVSVDSATMANKGLEMIEAAYLFDMPADRIEVVIHPQSIIHSLVDYADGSTLAQLGLPDMRTPIALAWSWPRRMAWPAPRLDLAQAAQLTFQPADLARFPLLGLARQALEAGGAAPAVFNAANEVAVRAFLDRRLGFLDIAATVEATLEAMGGERSGGEGEPLESALQTDGRARGVARSVMAQLASVA